MDFTIVGKAKKINRMIKTKIPYLLIVVSMLLSGCNVSPPNVSASIPLVTKDNFKNYTLLPQGVASKLDAAQLGQVIKHKNSSWIIGSNYTSALGYFCKQLEVNDAMGHSYDAAVCKVEQGWFFVPPLMSEAPSQLR